MFIAQPQIDYSDVDLGTFQEGSVRRSRNNSTQTISRSRRSQVKKRSSSKRSGSTAIVGIGHRRNRKWSW